MHSGGLIKGCRLNKSNYHAITLRQMHRLTGADRFPLVEWQLGAMSCRYSRD